MSEMHRAIPIPRAFSLPEGYYAVLPAKDIEGVTVNDVYVGNGVSELIMMAMQALLDNGMKYWCLHRIILFGPQQSTGRRHCRTLYV